MKEYTATFTENELQAMLFYMESAHNVVDELTVRQYKEIEDAIEPLEGLIAKLNKLLKINHE